MSVLEEFWYGNLDPAEYDASPSEEYKEFIRLISRNEEKLVATMTDEQKDLFSRYQDCVREFQAMAECMLFQNSFRLGARMLLEIMETDIVNHRYRYIQKQDISSPRLYKKYRCGLCFLEWNKCPKRSIQNYAKSQNVHFCHFHD